MPLIDIAIAVAIIVAFAWLINTRNVFAEEVKPILNLVLALILVGMALWLINTYIPMAGSIKAILNIVVIVATCVRILQVVGLWNELVRLWGDLTHRRVVH